MHTMKAKILVAVLSIICCLSNPAFSQQMDIPLARKTVKTIVEQSLAIMDKYDVEALHTKVKARLVDIGLTYLPETNAPTDPGLLVGKNKVELAMLWGMYTANLSYALEFGKRFDQFIEAMGRIEELIDFDSVAFRKDPSYKANAKKNGQFMYTLIQKTEEDPSLLPLVIGAMYGLDIESVYGLCMHGLVDGITPEYLKFMNDYVPGMEITKEITAVFDKALAGDPNKPMEFAKLLDSANKGTVIQSLLKVHQDCKGVYKESDLRAMVAIIEKARNPLIGKAR